MAESKILYYRGLLDIGIFEKDSDSESAYVYQNYIDDEIISVNYNESNSFTGVYYEKVFYTWNCV